MAQKVVVAHSPDSDDAFMFYGLATGKIRSSIVEFVHELRDIQTLNDAASEGRYDMTAISYHAYPYVADRYILTSAGSSVGDGYGPIVVSKHNTEAGALAGKTGLSIMVATIGGDGETALPRRRGGGGEAIRRAGDGVRARRRPRCLATPTGRDRIG